MKPDTLGTQPCACPRSYGASPPPRACHAGSAGGGEKEALLDEGPPRIKLAGVDRDAPLVIGEALPCKSGLCCVVGGGRGRAVEQRQAGSAGRRRRASAGTRGLRVVAPATDPAPAFRLRGCTPAGAAEGTGNVLRASASHLCTPRPGLPLQARCLSSPTRWTAGSSAWWRCRCGGAGVQVHGCRCSACCGVAGTTSWRLNAAVHAFTYAGPQAACLPEHHPHTFPPTRFGDAAGFLHLPLPGHLLVQEGAGLALGGGGAAR